MKNPQFIIPVLFLTFALSSASSAQAQFEIRPDSSEVIRLEQTTEILLADSAARIRAVERAINVLRGRQRRAPSRSRAKRIERLGRARRNIIRATDTLNEQLSRLKEEIYDYVFGANVVHRFDEYEPTMFYFDSLRNTLRNFQNETRDARFILRT